jgi:hypothetical protein
MVSYHFHVLEAPWHKGRMREQQAWFSHANMLQKRKILRQCMRWLDFWLHVMLSRMSADTRMIFMRVVRSTPVSEFLSSVAAGKGADKSQ